MRYNWKIDFIKNRKHSFMFSGIITVLGIVILLIFGLNLGVDFRAGTTIDVNMGKSVEQSLVQEAVSESKLEAESITIGGTNADRATIRFKDSINKTQVEALLTSIENRTGLKPDSEENTVSPDLAQELAQKAIYAVLIASVFIMVYVAIRFEWRFAIAGIAALLHDAFIVISLFSLLRFEVNLPFIAAVLTIIGYSINDTIVIFDRIRSNMRYAKIRNEDDLGQLVNESIWQTMTRSINTVMTVLICSLILFFFGGIPIKLFSLAMIFGLVSGCYSSVFIASPIWYLLKKASINSNNATAVQKAVAK